VRDLLADILPETASRGEIAADDLRAAAADLPSMWLGFRTIERHLVVGTPMTLDEYQACVSRSVAMLLRGVGAPTPPDTSHRPHHMPAADIAQAHAIRACAQRVNRAWHIA
jgi:hypothetical protein